MALHLVPPAAIRVGVCVAGWGTFKETRESEGKKINRSKGGEKNMVQIAPFETFREHSEREESGVPCREKALEYDNLDEFLRSSLLKDLRKCIPVHYRNKVFDGISSFD